MDKITEQMKYFIATLRQIQPRECYNDIQEGIEQVLFEYLHEMGVTRFPMKSRKAFRGDTYSLEMCQQAYEDGYAIIINDGKIIGYREEAPAM